jgi:hypothetical protein
VRHVPILALPVALALLVTVASPTAASATEPFAHGCPRETLEEGAAASLNNPAAKKAIAPASCPFDDGAELYAVFFYREAEPVIIHVALSGCRFPPGRCRERVR